MHVSAAYDYLGRRVARTVYGSPNVVTKYAYDGDRIIAEYDGSGTLLRKFIYGPGIDEPICLIEVADNNAVYYYHLDGLGSVVALSHVNRVLVERYTYDIFGRPTIRDANGTEIEDSAFGNPYRFTGRAYDAETALYYYRARYYDYATARFLQPDPIGYGDGLNLYAYVGNNALNFVDPQGLLTFGFGFSGTGGAVVGGTGGAQIVFDTKGNIGLYVHAGAGGYYGGSGSIAPEVSFYHGDIYDLRGSSTTAGLGAGEVFGVTVEGNFSGNWLQDASGSGITVSPGFFGGTPTAYGFKEYGVVVPPRDVPSLLLRGGARIAGWIKNMFYGGEDKRTEKSCFGKFGGGQGGRFRGHGATGSW